jgi:hypothetical protein
VEEDQGTVNGVESSLQRSEGRGDGEMAIFLGVADSEAIEDKKCMKLLWRFSRQMQGVVTRHNGVEVPGCQV